MWTCIFETFKRLKKKLVSFLHRKSWQIEYTKNCIHVKRFSFFNIFQNCTTNFFHQDCATCEILKQKGWADTTYTRNLMDFICQKVQCAQLKSLNSNLAFHNTTSKFSSKKSHSDTLHLKENSKKEATDTWWSKLQGQLNKILIHLLSSQKFIKHYLMDFLHQRLHR